MKFDGDSSSRPLRTVSGDSASGTDAGCKVDAIIAGFPGPVALRVSRAKWLGLLAFSLAFACSIYVIHDGSLRASGAWMAWLGLAFCGICGIVAAVMALPGAARFTLRADGFETTTLFRKFRTPWQRVSDFAVSQYSMRRGRHKPFVGYNDAHYPTDNLSRRMTGYNAALPDTSDLSHNELARLMNQWRALALARQQ